MMKPEPPGASSFSAQPQAPLHRRELGQLAFPSIKRWKSSRETGTSRKSRRLPFHPWFPGTSTLPGYGDFTQAGHSFQKPS